jgi:hypothetical protein
MAIHCNAPLGNKAFSVAPRGDAGSGEAFGDPLAI